MKVLTVNLSIHTESGGGTAERTLQLSRWLAKKNCECTVLTLDENLDGLEALAGASLVVLPCFWRRYHLPLGGFKVVKRLVQSNEIIHLMGHWSLLNAIVCFYARKFNKPYVICPAGALPIFGRSVFLKHIYNFFLGKTLVQNASGWIAITKLEREHFEAYGISRSKIAIFPNCINETDFDIPKNFPESSFKKIIPFSPYILFMGRLNLIKGPDLLLNAFIQIKQLFPQFHLVYAGPDNGLLGALNKDVELYGLQDHVHFIGNVEGSLKVMVYRNASLLVVPSRQEAMSIVAVEAGICGLPVLLTDECGLEEIREVNQYLEVKVSSDSIANSLKILLADEYFLRGIGLKWREIVREKYRWDKLIFNYLEYFEKLLVILKAPK